MMPPLKKDRATKLYHVQIPIAGTDRHKWVCTGERGLQKARDIVQSVGVDRLLHLEKADALSAEAIALVTSGRVTTCEEIVELWSQWFQPRRSANTHYLYMGYLSLLMNQYQCHKRPISFLTEVHIRDFVNAPGVPAATAEIRLVVVRTLFRFASARAYLVGNPAELVEVNRRSMSIEQLTPKETLPYSDEEWAKVLSLPADDRWRDWAILSYCTGLRLIDCIGLEWASFTPDGIVVFPIKTRMANKVRLFLPFADPLVGRRELMDLIGRLLARERDDPLYVWPIARLEYEDPVVAKTIRNQFARRLQQLKIVGKRFHGLRTTFARRLEAAGKTLEQIAVRMGHTNTDTTKVYLGQ